MLTPATAKTVFLRDVAADPLLRFRIEPEDETNARVAEYAEAMADYEGWGEFPPLEAVQLTEQEAHESLIDGKTRKVGYPAGTLILVGGFTRSAAALKQGIEKAPANFRPGTWHDAQALAWAENLHGKPRTMYDKMAVIESVRKHHALNSDKPIGPRGIAKLTRIPKSTVERLLKELDQPEPPSTPSTCPADSPDPASAMRSPRPVSDTQGRIVERDMWNRPIAFASRLRTTFEATSEALKVTRRSMGSFLRLLAANHGRDGSAECLMPGMKGVELKGIADAIFGQLERLESSVPWIVCPACDGSEDAGECKTCRDRKYLTRPQLDDLTPNLERKARRWVDGAAAA